MSLCGFSCQFWLEDGKTNADPEVLHSEPVVWLRSPYEVVILYVCSLGKHLLPSMPADDRLLRMAYIKRLVILVAKCTNVLAGLVCRLLNLTTVI